MVTIALFYSAWSTADVNITLRQLGKFDWIDSNIIEGFTFHMSGEAIVNALNHIDGVEAMLLDCMEVDQ